MKNKPLSGSVYEQYDALTTHISDSRLPIGSDIILKFITPLDEDDNSKHKNLADIDCGVGLYHEMYNLLPNHSAFHYLEASSKRLEAARATVMKSRRDDKQYEFHLGSALSLPFKDKTLNHTLLLWMLHHLDTHQGDDSALSTEKRFPNALLAIEEALRVLKPGGSLIIGTTTPEQLSPIGGSLWYYQYFQDAAKTLQLRFPSMQELITLITLAGGVVLESKVITPAFFAWRSLDPTGPFDESFRASDSLFSWYHDKPQLLNKHLSALREDIFSGDIALSLATSVLSARQNGQGVVLRVAR